MGRTDDSVWPKYCGLKLLKGAFADAKASIVRLCSAWMRVRTVGYG